MNMHTLDGAAVGFLVWVMLMLSAMVNGTPARTSADWYDVLTMFVCCIGAGGLITTIAWAVV